jgi:nitrogen fixation/metabolism regulation signal transduction histidine kinase
MSDGSEKGTIDNRKVKSFLINPRLQIGLVAYSILLTLTFQITAFIANKMFYENFARTAGTRTPIEEHAALTFLSGQQLIAFNVYLTVSVIAIVVAFITGIIYSHKVAGPLHAMKRHFQMCADKGRLEPLKLREGDYLKDVADEFNKLTKGN